MYVVKRNLDGCADSAQDVRSKNWRELVPSLSGLVHGMGMLPSTSVPGFHIRPLRGWEMHLFSCDIRHRRAFTNVDIWTNGSQISEHPHPLCVQHQRT